VAQTTQVCTAQLPAFSPIADEYSSTANPNLTGLGQAVGRIRPAGTGCPLMKRWTVCAGILIALVTTVVGATAAPHTTTAADRICTSLVAARNAHSYPPDRQWVWTIPNGCVYTRDVSRPAGCSADPDIGCSAAPDVHVRFQRREYVFHLTLRGVPAKAKGLWNATGRSFLVAHDGRAPKTRQRLFIDFSGAEFDGPLLSGPSQGQADIGPVLHWRIVYTLDKRKGLCCPRVDPGSPDVSPFDVAPSD
jgi:hypothetical protein